LYGRVGSEAIVRGLENRTLLCHGHYENGVPSTICGKDPEHIVVARGGLVVFDFRILDAHGAAGDVDAAADAVAVGGAIAAGGLVVRDLGTHDAGGGVLDEYPAAQSVAAMNPLAPRDHIPCDGRVRDGEESGDAVLVGAEDA